MTLISRLLAASAAVERGKKASRLVGKPAIVRCAIVAVAVGVGAAALLTPGSAVSADLPRTNLKVIGFQRGTIVWLSDAPFWETTIPESSNGQITALYTPNDQMGIDDKSMLRLLKMGVMDIAGLDITKFGGDDPRFEGCDLAGASLDFDTARAGCNAYRPILEKLLEEQWNIKLLTIVANSPQVFWCRVPVAGLADLNGKKIRVFNKSQIAFVNGLGGSAISMSFAEVVPALQRGVVDCAVTSPLGGNLSGWGEASTHLYPMSLGWGIGIQAVNLDSWKQLGPEVQEFLLGEYAKLEDQMWESAKAADADAANCNFGKDPCERGRKENLTLVPVRPEEAAQHKQIVEEFVLEDWAQRCGAQCVSDWNETVGKSLGLTATAS